MSTNQEIATIGDGNVFVKRGQYGAIKAVQGKITLYEEKGHLAYIQGKAMVTAAGYYELNKIGGLSIITPETLLLPDGTKVPNPYPIIDEKSGSISKVWVKKYAIGCGPTGNMVMTSSTLLFDITMYLIQDLMGNIKGNKKAGRVCMESFLTDEEKKTGIFQRIQGDMGIWVNINEPDILKSLNTFVNNKLMAERKAQTICERNAMKKHPALSVGGIIAQGNEKRHYASINVVGWTNDLNADDLKRLAAQAENGKRIELGKDFIDVEPDEHYDDVTDEDVTTSSTGELEEQPITSDETTSAPKTTETPQSDPKVLEELRIHLLAAKPILGDNEFDEIIAYFPQSIEEMNETQLKAAIIYVNKSVDKQVAEGGL
jgi:hypothetical protein